MGVMLIHNSSVSKLYLNCDYLDIETQQHSNNTVLPTKITVNGMTSESLYYVFVSLHKPMCIFNISIFSSHFYILQMLSSLIFF